jgi:regulator of replication initiation timing
MTSILEYSSATFTSVLSSLDYYKTKIEEFVIEIATLKENIGSLKHRVGDLETENNVMKERMTVIENHLKIT